jgi:hypothetical protein
MVCLATLPWSALKLQFTAANLMSTSHYSRPYQGPTPPRNTRKWTVAKLATIGALLIVDLLALIGSTNLGESIALACLVIVNLWALNAK